MSISEQVKELRAYSNASLYARENRARELLKEAADTIESLSAKLKAANVEWSAEDCGGWIPCKERLPKEKDGNVLICQSNGEVRIGSYSEYSRTWYKGEMSAVGGYEVITWKPLPEPYHEP